MTADAHIPRMGFGTFGRTGAGGVAAILAALEIGYRHLDTAQSYDTEAECGAAFRRSGLHREEVFFTTKISGENCTGSRLLPSLRQSLERMQLDRVDLTLIHWPVGPRGELPMGDYLPALGEAQAMGLTRAIGVSNFTISHLCRAEEILPEARFATNQVERHPYLQNRALAEHCAARGILITCYLPLARGACAGDPVIERIARAHRATPHQVALAFSLAEGHAVIPTSGNRTRIAENFAAGALALSASEIDAIRSLDRGERQIDPGWSPRWD